MTVAVLIACSGSKQNQRMSALALYTGSTFRLALSAARQITADQNIYIVSALHGIIPGSRPINPYERVLGPDNRTMRPTRPSVLAAIHAQSTCVSLLPARYRLAADACGVRIDHDPVACLPNHSIGFQRQLFAQIAERRADPFTGLSDPAADEVARDPLLAPGLDGVPVLREALDAQAPVSARPAHR